MASDKYIQIDSNRGHVSVKKNPILVTKLYLNDFYTVCIKDPKQNIGLRKKCEYNHLPVFKQTDTSVEYLCSDFARFCLCLLKNNKNIDCGEMSLIPKEPIPISEELREYIEEFLPDFYGIRNE